MIFDLFSWLTSGLGYGLLVLVPVGVTILFALGIYEYNFNDQYKPRNRSQFAEKGKVKRVAIIGAGSSGITAAKEAIELGFDTTVFEQTGEIGGNWAYKDTDGHASVYRSTCINTSKQLMCYSDFPMPNSLPTFPHHKQIIKYFNDYVDNFGVRKYIRFNTQIVKVEQVDDGKWRVDFRRSDGTPLFMMADGAKAEPAESEVFDAVIVCNGHHHVPLWPSFPGQDSFKGQVMHSHSYKDPTTGYDFRDKRVLVVGIGNSGVDIANELCRVSSQVWVSTRSGAWIAPKFSLGLAADHALFPRWAMVLLPKKVMYFIMEHLFRLLITLYNGSMKSWNLDPGVGVLQVHPTISQEFLHRVGTGSIVIKRDIEHIGQRTVTFKDGETIEVDAIIFATGYSISFPFLNKTNITVGQDNDISLFKFVWNPDLMKDNTPPTLAFIGLVQPFGAIMPIAEIQARWITRVWAGEVGLPTADEQRADISEYKDYLAKRYLKRARHVLECDGGIYMEEVAGYLDCRPSLVQNISLFKEIFSLPAFPPVFRLNGKGAKPELASKMMKSFFRDVYVQRPEGAHSTL